MSSLLGAHLEFARDNTKLQQFGQGDDQSTFNGATGCTHTCLQRLIKMVTGHQVSHDEISKIAGYPWPASNKAMRGLRSGNTGSSEVEKVLKHFHIPMKVVFGWSWAKLNAALWEYGVVEVAILYGYWPEWRGYHYQGVTADGRPGGYSIRGGKTQLRGFEKGAHATLYIGRKNYPKSTGAARYRLFANEPNHGSPSRPEKPDYDTVTTAQARRAYEQYATLGRKLQLWVQTRVIKPKVY
jgi:hypothetical protein